ncbi:MAG: tRNA-(ms[2]io[6]A)-hydroxylase [Myxococcales bacterium]|nr:tRNA-(ms[2]io[6]A)-hydroxylase [Myxococcales bacterium]
MLNLASDTPAQWVEEVVEPNLEEVLVDHAHCEKKAAGTAVNLIFAHVEHPELVRELSEIAREELEHFEAVLALLARRGMAFRRQFPSSYGARLGELVRKEKPGRFVDRMLIAALIEARSCERFALLRDGLADAELAAFYGELYASEARHHATYVRMAATFVDRDEVAARLRELALREAEIIAETDGMPRLHS